MATDGSDSDAVPSDDKGGGPPGAGESPTRARPEGARRKYEITTSYRDTYGGNPGTDMSRWRSSSSSPVKGPRSLDRAEGSALSHVELGMRLEAVVRDPLLGDSVGAGNVIGEHAAGNKHNPLEDIAVLTTGQVLRHRDAMESLVEALKASSLDSVYDEVRDETVNGQYDGLRGITTSSLIATNGGTHLMTVNLIESSDRGMRDLCAEGLIEMFRREPSALQEVGSSRETVSKLLGVSVRELLGRGAKATSPGPSSSTYRELFKALVASPSDHVPKSCAEHKVVHKLVERLKSSSGSVSASPFCDKMMVLSALQTMVDTGNEYYVSSFVWNGALDVVLPMLAGGDLNNDQRTAVAKLVASVCVGKHGSRSTIEAWVCTVDAVKGLSLLLADDDIALEEQVLAARVLLEVSNIHAKKQEVLDAMIDYCLPRACEIIIDGDDDDELVTIVAAIAANLAQDSTVAMEVLIFHANVLRRVVGVLVGSKSYDGGRELLGAACAFATH